MVNFTILMLKTIDLERVEILRGPQGTLFGRNTVARVIHLTRSKPTGEQGGKVRVGFGDYDYEAKFDNIYEPEIMTT